MTGRLDRRALFTSGAAAALLAATGLSAQAAPRRGGRLRIAVSRDSGSLDLIMRSAVYDTLTEVGADGVLRGELATDWRAEARSNAWRFNLRRDVTFHDGRALNAEDVVSSLKSTRPDLDVMAVSASKIRIVPSEACENLPMVLADPELAIYPAGETNGHIGTGLYRVSAWKDGRAFVGKRCDTHYKDGRAGWFDAIEVAVISDPSVRAEALREGYVDVAELPNPEGLMVGSDYFVHPESGQIELAARREVARPRLVGERLPLDDGRISERWWML